MSLEPWGRKNKNVPKRFPSRNMFVEIASSGVRGMPGTPVGACQEKPLDQIEPGGKGNRDARHLHAQPYRRRGNTRDVAEEVRDAGAGEERGDDPAGQRCGKQEPGTGPPFPFTIAGGMPRVFPRISGHFAILGGHRVTGEEKGCSRRIGSRRPSDPEFRTGCRRITSAS